MIRYISSLPPIFFYKNLLFKLFLHIKLYQPYQSFFIGLERVNHLLFVACYKAQKENKAKTKVYSEERSEIKHSFSQKNSNIYNLLNKNKDD